MDWNPRTLPGGIYCSPSCGGRCKRSDYDQAVKDADALASRFGEGWEPRVWENLGWHFEVAKGVFKITHDLGVGYTAWFNGTKQVIAHAETAEDALGFVIQDARTMIRRIEDELKSAA